MTHTKHGPNMIALRRELLGEPKKPPVPEKVPRPTLRQELLGLPGQGVAAREEQARKDAALLFEKQFLTFVQKHRSLAPGKSGVVTVGVAVFPEGVLLFRYGALKSFIGPTCPDVNAIRGVLYSLGCVHHRARAGRRIYQLWKASIDYCDAIQAVDFPEGLPYV